MLLKISSLKTVGDKSGAEDSLGVKEESRL